MIERATTWGMVVALGMMACGGGGESEFAGTWQEQGPEGMEAQWVFGEDGSLSWNVVGAPAGGFGDLRYEVVSTGTPRELDIRGFEEGPMTGQELYCIAVFPEEGILRMDCRPGPPDGDTNRPTSFSEDALDLTRVPEDEGGS